MKTHVELKSKTYLEPMIPFVQNLLGIRFSRSGRDRFTAFCPFHADTKDSFRVYVNDRGEVRFHCFGACNKEWDIYDIIMLSRKTGFRQAVKEWADYLGIGEYAVDADKPIAPDLENIPEPDEPPGFAQPEELDPEIANALDEAGAFYNDLLLCRRADFEHIWKYLARRGVHEDTIRKFNIGYSPPYQDEQYNGRALIDRFLARFNDDYKTFQPFEKGGLIRLLNDQTARGWGYYRRQIMFEREDPFSKNHGDYFAGRIVFPIYDIHSQPVGFMGRRPDNRGNAVWMKQKATDTEIRPKGWLYGIDKAIDHIRRYGTIILVEGIFDYFAFYNLLQIPNKPVVVSTIGSYLTPEVLSFLMELDIKNFIVAYDWDDAGRKGIGKVAHEIGGKIFFLGGMEEGQDPFDKLKQNPKLIDAFSLNHLLTAAQKAQEKTDKPVNVSFFTSGPPGQRNVVFSPSIASLLKPAIKENTPEASNPPESKDFIYDTEDFLPLLTYDHANKAMLDQTIARIIQLLDARPLEPKSEKIFTLPNFFILEARHYDLGPSLILWLRLAIEQQTKKRKIRKSDNDIAQWLQTSRITISKYKKELMNLGLLRLDTSVRPQRISVLYYPRP